MRYFAYFLLFSLKSIVYSQGPATWSSSQDYTHPSLVIDGTTTYMSVQNVPANIEISNTAYWKTLDDLVPNENPSGNDDLTTPDASEVDDLTTPDSTEVPGTSPQNITLPHQGRVLISGTPFDGQGSFRFGLVNSAGEIIWNHTGASGVPSSNLSIQVSKGFYTVNLGDTNVAGMGLLSANYFDIRNPLKLRIWFDDGVNGLQQLGQDHNLRFSPYAISSLSESKGDENWGTLANPYGWDGETIVGYRNDNYAVPDGKVLLLMDTGEYRDDLDAYTTSASYNILRAGSVVPSGALPDSTFYGLLVDENPAIEPVSNEDGMNFYPIPKDKYLIITYRNHFFWLFKKNPITDPSTTEFLITNQVLPAVFEGNGDNSIRFMSKFSGYLISSENLKKLR